MHPLSRYLLINLCMGLVGAFLPSLHSKSSLLLTGSGAGSGLDRCQQLPVEVAGNSLLRYETDINTSTSILLISTIRHRRSLNSSKLSMASQEFMDVTMDPTILVVVVAGVLGVASQTLINSMLKGDQGLSAFLSDGRGYGKSNFKARGKGNDGTGTGTGTDTGTDTYAPVSSDPLPWLKLPKFSYVDVAGQEKDVSEDVVVAKLEELTVRMRQELELGDKEKAAASMKEMDSLMEQYGFEYKQDR